METNMESTTLLHYLSYSLNSLDGVLKGITQGTATGAMKGDTRSFDNVSFRI